MTNSEPKDIRWKQRYSNFERAYQFLERAVALGQYDELQAAGLIQSFEFTFELSWKTLKDYLVDGGYELRTPREVIKQAFQVGIIEDGHCWIEMLTKRNELTHTYNEKQSAAAIEIIRIKFFPAIKQLAASLSQLIQTQ